MDLKQIAKNAKDTTVIEYVLLDELNNYFLEGNSKKHDIGSLTESIQKYGFKDPIAFDPNLNNGAGGIVEGNGRLEALKTLRLQGDPPPRGITNDWQVPVIFGVSATSETEAIAFSIDHNWSVTWGSNLDLEQITSMFDNESLFKQIEGLEIRGDSCISFENTSLREIIDSFDSQAKDDLIKESAEIDEINQEWGIIIELKNEQDQCNLLEELNERGFKCRALI